MENCSELPSIKLLHSSIEEMYDFQDDFGVTPIMLSVKKQNLHLSKHLVGKKVNLELIGHDENNVMHYAAYATKEIIEVFGDQTELLRKKNESGFTPLHVACNQDLPDCVQAFLCAGADLNIAANC